MLTHSSIWFRFSSCTTLADIGSFPEKVRDVKYVIIGPCIPSETTKSLGEGGNLMKPPEFFVVMSIFLK